MKRTGRHAPPKMTRAHNRNAAFMAVNIGELDRIDPALISRTTGVALAEIERLIAERRAREGLSCLTM